MIADPAWLADTADAYNGAAEAYADRYRHLIDRTPYERSALTLFAEQVRAAGGGPVADVGCGAGRIAGFLSGLGVDVFGIDLAPTMVEMARRDHPGLRFEVGSMTELDLAEGSLGGLLAWYSTIHVPDAELPGVLKRFRLAVRPGGPLLLGFHVGDETQHRTRSSDGRPMNLYVHLRQPEQLAALLADAGFAVEAQLTTFASGESPLGGVLFAR